MESNELPSKLNYANLSSLSLSEENIAQICTNMGNEDISFIRIVIANDKAISYKRELKVSFSDRIATFGNKYLLNLLQNQYQAKIIFHLGGTMGLFTGMSLLSLVELIGPIFLYDYGVILSTFGLRLKFLNFCLHKKKF